jgi:hypothetical protein
MTESPQARGQQRIFMVERPMACKSAGEAKCARHLEALQWRSRTRFPFVVRLWARHNPVSIGDTI